MNLPNIFTSVAPYLTQVGFFLFALFYWVYGFFIVYHLTRFGIGTKPKLLALIFFLGSAFLFTAAVVAFWLLDFSTVADRFNSQIFFNL